MATSDQAKREKIRSYFSKSHAGFPIVLMLIGIVLVPLSLSNRQAGEVGVGAGLLLFTVGLLGLVVSIVRKSARPSDEQMDQWLKEDVERIKQRSLSKLGLDASHLKGSTLAFTGPILWTTTGVPKKDLVHKKGRDDIVRFGVYRATVIQLTDQLLAAYACDFNFLKNAQLNEETDEFYYRDIASVSTHEISTSYKLPNGQSLVHAQAFRLAVVSGDSIEVTIGAAKLAEITGGIIPTTGAERAVGVIRAMLREKKQA